MSCIKILSKEWFSAFPVNSGGNKSFGPISIDEFKSALENVKRDRVNSDTEKWIKETGFFAMFPPEMVVGTNAPLVGFLSAYNDGVKDFLNKNPSFYLWLQA